MDKWGAHASLIRGSMYIDLALFEERLDIFSPTVVESENCGVGAVCAKRWVRACRDAARWPSDGSLARGAPATLRRLGALGLTPATAPGSPPPHRSARLLGSRL
jgi:hypothetical protein